MEDDMGSQRISKPSAKRERECCMLNVLRERENHIRLCFS